MSCSILVYDIYNLLMLCCISLQYTLNDQSCETMSASLMTSHHMATMYLSRLRMKILYKESDSSLVMV